MGLEILVGGDIIRTVAEAPTLESVAVLGGIAKRLTGVQVQSLGARPLRR